MPLTSRELEQLRQKYKTLIKEKNQHDNYLRLLNDENRSLIEQDKSLSELSNKIKQNAIKIKEQQGTVDALKRDISKKLAELNNQANKLSANKPSTQDRASAPPPPPPPPPLQSAMPLPPPPPPPANAGKAAVSNNKKSTKKRAAKKGGLMAAIEKGKKLKKGTKKDSNLQHGEESHQDVLRSALKNRRTGVAGARQVQHTNKKKETEEEKLKRQIEQMQKSIKNKKKEIKHKEEMIEEKRNHVQTLTAQNEERANTIEAQGQTIKKLTQKIVSIESVKSTVADKVDGLLQKAEEKQQKRIEEAQAQMKEQENVGSPSNMAPPPPPPPPPPPLQSVAPPPPPPPSDNMKVAAKIKKNKRKKSKGKLKAKSEKKTQQTSSASVNTDEILRAAQERKARARRKLVSEKVAGKIIDIAGNNWQVEGLTEHHQSLIGSLNSGAIAQFKELTNSLNNRLKEASYSTQLEQARQALAKLDPEEDSFDYDELEEKIKGLEERVSNNEALSEADREVIIENFASENQADIAKVISDSDELIAIAEQVTSAEEKQAEQEAKRKLEEAARERERRDQQRVEQERLKAEKAKAQRKEALAEKGVAAGQVDQKALQDENQRQVTIQRELGNADLSVFDAEAIEEQLEQQAMKFEQALTEAEFIEPDNMVVSTENENLINQAEDIAIEQVRVEENAPELDSAPAPDRVKKEDPAPISSKEEKPNHNLEETLNAVQKQRMALRKELVDLKAELQRTSKIFSRAKRAELKIKIQIKEIDLETSEKVRDNILRSLGDKAQNLTAEELDQPVNQDIDPFLDDVEIVPASIKMIIANESSLQQQQQLEDEQHVEHDQEEVIPSPNRGPR